MARSASRAPTAAPELAEHRGLRFVDAPVLETKQPAQQGDLVVLASGPDDLRDRLAPIFDAAGGRCGLARLALEPG